MSRFKKRLLIIVAVVCMMFQLPATGMPVIDISAIAQAVTQYITTIQNWNQQLQHWKEEYDRLKQASAQIVSGDFTAVMRGIGNLAGQMAGWAKYHGLEDASQWGYNVKTGSYSLLNLISNSELLLANWDLLESQFKTNQARIEESARNDGEYLGDSLFNVSDTTLKGVVSTLTGFGNLMGSGASLYNSVAENINALFEVSPSELVKVYDETIQKALKQEGYKDYEDFKKKMSKQKNKIQDIERELAKIDPSTSAMQYSQKQAQIEVEKMEYEKMETLDTWYKEMQYNKKEIENNQPEYEKKEEEEIKKKQEEEKKEVKDTINAAYNETVRTNQEMMAERLEEILSDFALSGFSQKSSGNSTESATGTSPR